MIEKIFYLFDLKFPNFPGSAIFSMEISRRMAWMNLTFWLNDQSVIHSCSGLIKQKQVNGRYGVAWMCLHVCSSIFHSFVKNYSVKCFSGRTFDAKQMNCEKQEAKTNLVAKMSNELSWYCFMVKDACKMPCTVKFTWTKRRTRWNRRTK